MDLTHWVKRNEWVLDHLHRSGHATHAELAVAADEAAADAASASRLNGAVERSRYAADPSSVPPLPLSIVVLIRSKLTL
jgi:hypothetical protein